MDRWPKINMYPLYEVVDILWLLMWKFWVLVLGGGIRFGML